MNNPATSGLASIFLTFLKLGCISFGGPIAHLGYFRQEFVAQKKWLTEEAYAELVALCQFLPGPASSQVGMVLGYSQKGYLGAIVAWLGFTLPSACLLILFATGLTQHRELIAPEIIQGLKLLAVAVVIQAVAAMAKSLCPDRSRMLIMALVATLAALFSSFAISQLVLMLLAAIVGILFLSPSSSHHQNILSMPMSRSAGLFCLGLFFLFLLLLPLLNVIDPSLMGAMVSACYRAGSLVFGGGHVVLPLLESAFVARHWVSQEVFLAGYGATQIMPGPLFTFAAFLGASITSPYSAWVTGVVALLAIFVPSFLLVMGALPFWTSLRQHRRIQAALMGVNAAVVGILLAALYNPIALTAIHDFKDVILVLVAAFAIIYGKWPIWLIAILMSSLTYLIKMSF